MTLGTIIILAIITVALILIAIFAHFEDKRKQAKNSLRNIRKGKDENGEWIFTDLSRKIYYSFTQKDPEDVAKKLGINVKAYYKNCEISGEKINLEKAIVSIFVSVLLSIAVLILSIATKEMLWAVIGLVIFSFLAFYPLKRTEEKANAIRAQIVDELPRFLDLLQTALYINLPVEKAIKTTAEHLTGTILAKEFLEALAEVQIGAYDWRSALEKTANKYEISSLSDCVVDLVNAYDKGISIYDTVSRKNKEIKQTRLLMLKQNASKLNSTILFPIVMFKLMPIIVILCIPIAMQLKGTGFI